jgi:hypothetical protein
MLNSRIRLLLAAEAHYFFLDEKVTKNQVIRDASAAQALCAANQIKPKARSFCRLLSHKAIASGKITNAFAAAQAYLFYLISPEAARLTVLAMKQDYSHI